MAREKGPQLKALVEAQTGQLRALAMELQRNADTASFLTPGTRSIQRSWAQTILQIADELTVAVNEPGGGRRVRVLNKWAAAAASAVVLLTPTINHVAQGALDELGLPDAIAEMVQSIVNRSEAIEDAHAVSPQGSNQEAAAETLYSVVIARIRELDPDIDDLEDAAVATPRVVGDTGQSFQVTVGPMGFGLELPPELATDSNEVGSATAAAVTELLDQLDIQIAEDRAVQDQIDQARGK